MKNKFFNYIFIVVSLWVFSGRLKCAPIFPKLIPSGSVLIFADFNFIKVILSKLFKNRDKRKRFAHIGAGIVILIHAYEKYETGHGSYVFLVLLA